MASMGFISSTTQTTSSRSKNTSVLVPETFTHSIAFGQTGSGKTTGFIYPNLEKRILAGHGILLYDFKGQEHTSVKFLAKKAERLDDVVEIGKPWGEYMNLIGGMSEEDLDFFFSLTIKNSKENSYWENTAKSLGQSVLRVLFSLEHFMKVYLDLCGKDTRLTKYLETSHFKYPLHCSVESLIDVCRHGEHLKLFVGELDALQTKVKRFVYNYAKDQMASRKPPKDPERYFDELFCVYEQFKETLAAVKAPLALYEKSNDERLNDTIISSLTGPLLSLSQNPFFNQGTFDIAEALNQGKIVVVNTSGLSNATLEALNNSILNELSHRTHLSQRHPVTMFIDEAQRILSDKIDLPVDVLREAKVDVVLATQNRDLLIDKLGETKFKALMGNITFQLYFQNSMEMAHALEVPLQELKTFSCYTNQDDLLNVVTTTPVFISESEKNAVEYLYQESHGVLKNFAVSFFNTHSILKYIPRLYKKEQLLLIDIESGDHEVVKVESVYSKVQYNRRLKEFLQEVVTHIGGSVYEKYAYLYDSPTLLKRVG